MIVQAEVQDATHLKLKEPLNAEVGSVIILEIIESSDRDDYLFASAALLERAYGDDEPDYSEAGVPIHKS